MAGPSVTTLKPLFALSGNRCAFPGCREPLLNGDVLVGVVCHIKGAKPGSARYDASQSEYERHGFGNLIVLCANHHKVVDTDTKTYTVRELQDMKYIHENRRIEEFSISDQVAEKIAWAMGGMAAGATLANLAREAAPYIGAIFNSLPKMTLERLPRLLKAAEPSLVSYAHANEPGKQIGEKIVGTFRSNGWRVQELDPRSIRVWRNSEPSVVVLIAHNNAIVIEKSVEAVSEHFESLGLEWTQHMERGTGTTTATIGAFGVAGGP